LALAIEEYGIEVERQKMQGRDFEGPTTIGEIKRGDDLFHSILDKRLVNQAKIMHSTGKHRFLILAGDLGDERYRMKPVVGALLSCVFQYQLGVIPVPKNENVIAWVIHQILEKVDGKEPHPINYTRSRRYDTGLKRNVGMEMYCSIPGIGRKSAPTLLKAYPTMVQLVEASITDLKALAGIGTKRAETIYYALRGQY
jgi:ERCC4-type nuclease